MRIHVIANPRAYIDDPNPDFDPELVLDLEAELASRVAPAQP